MKRFIGLQIILVLLVLTGELPAQPAAGPRLSSLTGEFSRTLETVEGIDSISGTLYYPGPQKIYLAVNYPLQQIMVVEGRETRLYYPASGKAFLLLSDNPVVLPLIPGLVAAIRPDYGLGVLGFKLDKQHFNGDTLLTEWIHGEFPDKAGRFKISQIEDHILSSEFESPDGINHARSDFSDFRKADRGPVFPTRIRTTSKIGTTLTVETVRLRNLHPGVSGKEAEAQFRIPEDVQFEKRRW